MIDDIRELGVAFALPVVIILVCMVLLLTHTDGEVKTILAGAAGWIFKSGYTTYKGKPKNGG